MRVHQIVPEKAEQNTGLAPSAELYGLFSSPGKAADSHEEQQVGDRSKGGLALLLMTLIPTRSDFFGDGSWRRSRSS